MQAPPPNPVRLHWIPIEPSWIVAFGAILLAVLPHQVPASFRSILQSQVGALLYLLMVGWVFTKTPVLAMALLILFAGVRVANLTEGFAPMTLVKDKVVKKHRWLQEEVMMEDPHTIQERTEGPGLIIDEVTGEESNPWFGESVMDETPRGIQDRPVPTGPYATETEYPQTNSQ